MPLGVGEKEVVPDGGPPCIVTGLLLLRAPPPPLPPRRGPARPFRHAMATVRWWHLLFPLLLRRLRFRPVWGTTVLPPTLLLHHLLLLCEAKAFLFNSSRCIRFSSGTPRNGVVRQRKCLCMYSIPYSLQKKKKKEGERARRCVERQRGRPPFNHGWWCGRRCVPPTWPHQIAAFHHRLSQRRRRRRRPHRTVGCRLPTRQTRPHRIGNIAFSSPAPWLDRCRMCNTVGDRGNGRERWARLW